MAGPFRFLYTGTLNVGASTYENIVPHFNVDWPALPKRVHYPHSILRGPSKRVGLCLTWLNPQEGICVGVSQKAEAPGHVMNDGRIANAEVVSHIICLPRAALVYIPLVQGECPLNCHLGHQEGAGKAVGGELLWAPLKGRPAFQCLVDVCPITRMVMAKFVGHGEGSTPRRPKRRNEDGGAQVSQVHSFHAGEIDKADFNAKLVSQVEDTNGAIQRQSDGRSRAKRGRN